MRIRLAILAAIFAAFFFLTPPEVPLCGFRWLTGHPCPLCGLTHALFALSKGHIVEALRFHALSPLAAAILIAVVANRCLSSRIYQMTAVLFALYGIARLLI